MENKNNLLKIYKYGDEVLRQKTETIKNIDGQIVELIKNMTDTLHYTYNAVGLAAPQVGESLRISVIDLSMGQNPNDQLLLLNPEILETEGKEPGEEGCLSFPGISVSVNRAARIFLKTLDINGNEIKREIEGFMARVVQHETDHLYGTLIIDRVSSLKKQLVKKDIRRLQRNGEW